MNDSLQAAAMPQGIRKNGESYLWTVCVRIFADVNNRQTVASHQNGLPSPGRKQLMGEAVR